MVESEVVFRVKRYRPESGGRPTFQEYTIPYRSDMVVLDGSPLDGYWNLLNAKVVIKGGIVMVDKR